MLSFPSHLKAVFLKLENYLLKKIKSHPKMSGSDHAPVVQIVDNSVWWIKCSPTNTLYPLDSDLSAG